MVRWLTALALMVGVGCADTAGTTVVMTLTGSINVSDPGEHYEMFVTINGSAVSLRQFVVQFRASGDVNDPSQRPKEVVDYHDPSNVLGVADTELFTSVVASGIRFDVPENLRGATELFITVEQNGDTDPVPSRDVDMRCDLREATRGVLSCVMVKQENRNPDKPLVGGTAALILPDDGPNGF